MTQSLTNPETEIVEQPDLDQPIGGGVDPRAAREKAVARLQLLWQHRRFLFRVTAWGLVAAALIAFLIPKQYESTARLMPPDSQSGSGLAMLAALTGKTGAGLGAVAGDLLGVKSTGALFVGILRSRTIEDRVVERFD